MFTGITQGIGIIDGIYDDGEGTTTFEIEFPKGFCENLTLGASISVDGVCLTVTKKLTDTRIQFDVMDYSSQITTLNAMSVGTRVNVERAAKEGAEIGGHPLSGHVDFSAEICRISKIGSNCAMRIRVPDPWMRYIFSKGYIAINGTSLTVSEANRHEGWFEIWLIPETRRVTNFEEKRVGDRVNIEIERGTQVVVDTLRETLEERLDIFLPMLEDLLKSKGVDIDRLSEKVTVALAKKCP